MATPTRQQVVERAQYYFDKCAYKLGYWAGKPTNCWCMNDGTTQLSTSGHGGVNSGPYLASDCSGYTSWCWFLSSIATSPEYITGKFSKNYKPRTKNGDTFEESFVGIQIGDVVVRKYGYINPVTGYQSEIGHVALYIGNNTILHASSNYWEKTTSKHGMSRTIGSKANCAGYTGVCSYDSSWSADYDPEEIPDPVPDWNQSGGSPGAPGVPNEIFDSDIPPYLIYNQQYTKKYKKMKHYRMF